MQIGPLSIGWPNKRRETDPYWDTFINSPPVDPNNLLVTGLRGLPSGTVYPLKVDIHSPEIMARHVKELALFLGADRCAIASLVGAEISDGFTFGIACLVRSEVDPLAAQGVGGQAAALRGAYVTFNLAAWIRECGFNATRDSELDGEALAARAAAGHLDEAGRLVVPDLGPYIHVAQTILTDLPLAAHAPTEAR